MDLDLAHAQSIAIAAANDASTVLRAHLGRPGVVEKKGRIDLVTDADTRAERAIVAALRGAFPDHAILTEEGGVHGGSGEAQWIVDPLDGTTNFAHGLGLVAVSIALAVSGELMCGVVLSPFTEELFSAVRGHGAFCNGRALRVSAQHHIGDSLLATGFPYNLHENTARLMARFQSCLNATQGVRRLGSAALDLCFVAAGRFDAFWEENLQPWDTAAGVVIAEEDGGRVSDFNDAPYRVDNRQILATNGHIHGEMLELLTIEDPAWQKKKQ